MWMLLDIKVAKLIRAVYWRGMESDERWYDDNLVNMTNFDLTAPNNRYHSLCVGSKSEID